MKTRDELNREYRERYARRLKFKWCKVCGDGFYGTDKQKHCEKHKHKKHPRDVDKKRIIKKCAICGSEFWGRNKYCSGECYNKYINGLKKEKIEVKCKNCGKVFCVFPSHFKENNFCSRQCAWIFKRDKPNFKIRKEKHPQWQGGIKTRSTTTIRYKKWRRRIYERDRFICRFCGSNRNLIAHHIISWSDDAVFRYYISNGLTLCKECHLDIHDGNFMKLINYEKTKDKCKTKGIELRKKISDRIEELISERRNRDFKKSK